MRSPLRSPTRSLGLLLAGVVLVGCGNEAAPAPAPDFLAGAEVGAMAERELEEAHPRMAAGTVTCPDLDWELGASVRCVQVAELGGGRQVSIGGTVSVTAVEDGGRLRVQLDDTVAEYGVTGEHLTADLLSQARLRLVPPPTSVSCPYLSGPVGTAVRCRLVHNGAQRTVLARVTARDPGEHATSYAFDWKQVDRRGADKP